MINSSNASRRLGLSPEIIDSIFNKNGISDTTLFGEFSNKDIESLQKYLTLFMLKIDTVELRRLIIEHPTVKELILALACISGDGQNIEAIWIVFKIVIYKVETCIPNQ